MGEHTGRKDIKKMTREVLEKIEKQYPAVRAHIEALRRDYKAFNNSCRLAGEYTQALRDAGIITERERQILFVYTTV